MSPLDTNPPERRSPAAETGAPPVAGSGRLAMGWKVREGTTRLATLDQRTPLRLFRPTVGDGEPPLAVVANVSGGVVGGDRLAVEAALQPGAALAVTGQAAEKIYRAGGRPARLDTRIVLDGDARLDWLPQGTILFDDVRFARTTTIDLTAASRLLYGECLVFGRRHMGETLRSGLVDDRLDVRIDGRLVLADRFRLSDPARSLADPFGLDGATATALAVLHEPKAGDLLDAVRARLDAAAPGEGGGLRRGATRRGALVLVRWLGLDAAVLRRALGHFWQWARVRICGFPNQLPTVWAI